MPFFLVYMQTRGPVADLSPGGGGEAGGFWKDDSIFGETGGREYSGCKQIIKEDLMRVLFRAPPLPQTVRQVSGKKYIGYEEKNSENCGIAASNLPPFKSSAPVPSFRLR